MIINGKRSSLCILAFLTGCSAAPNDTTLPGAPAAGIESPGLPQGGQVDSDSDADNHANNGVDKQDSSAARLRTVVYLPNYYSYTLEDWARRLDFSRITYANLAFVDVSEQGSLSYNHYLAGVPAVPDTGIDVFVSVAHAAGVKVCVSVGGAENSKQLPSVLADGVRDTLAANLAQFAKDHGLDCIDLDLEGTAVTENAVHYQAFVSALSRQVHALGIELTAAVGKWFGEPIVPVLHQFDLVNIMAYDFHYGKQTQSSSVEDSLAELDWWVEDHNLPRDKAILGVPFYGYQWQDCERPAVSDQENGKSFSPLPYSFILSQAKAAGIEDQARTQDFVCLDGKGVFFNSPKTVEEKVGRAKEYGGIMIWELGQDAQGTDSLLRVVDQASR
ncbi:MAG TPA: glycosyl hydrolase family 18 protein [Polyangiaceae bacterium]|nr:glycosyl hydrolase family 18 protein [Polyangiaceae bacterium]